jgi:Vitamin K-dependent gamma-carboxylase
VIARARQGWLRFVATFGHAENLAVLRVAVAAAILLAPDIHDARRWATLPVGLHAAPSGLAAGWLSAAVSPLLANLAYLLVVTGALAALVGLFARAALTIVAAAELYLLGVPQLFGPVTHNHHLVWFAALLAASPCAEALSIDAWRRGRPRKGASPAFAVPLAVAWALVATVFFFPGLWKLRASGLAWITSDNLRNQMYWKWAQAGFVPALRVDRYPRLCRLGALGVVGFELGFGPALLSRRLRRAAVCGAWLFHLATAMVLRVSFFSLALSYVMFFDWRDVIAAARSRLAPRLQARVKADSLDRRCISARTLPTLGVGAILVTGSVLAGAQGRVDDWPFACYPTFQNLAGTEMPALRVEAVRDDGARIPLEAAPIVTDQRQRSWALMWSVMSRGDQRARLESYWRALAEDEGVREKARGARRIRFSRVWMSVIPEDRGRPPVREELLYEIDR